MKMILTDTNHAVIVDNDGQETFEVTCRDNGTLIIETAHDGRLSVFPDAPDVLLIRRVEKGEFTASASTESHS